MDKNWKNLSLFGKEILNDGSYRNLQEMIRTQNFGEPLKAFEGAVMHRQPAEMFKKAVDEFLTGYRQIAAGLLAKHDMLSEGDGKKAVELLKRCEILYGMTQTHSEASEAFRRANVEKGQNYVGTAGASWKRLETALGRGETKPERGAITVAHLQNHSFN